MFFPYSACLFPVLPDTCENGPSSCCCCVCKGREFKSKDFFFPLSGDTQKKMQNFRHECQRTEKKLFMHKNKFLVILTCRAIGEELIDIKIWIIWGIQFSYENKQFIRQEKGHWRVSIIKWQFFICVTNGYIEKKWLIAHWSSAWPDMMGLRNAWERCEFVPAM